MSDNKLIVEDPRVTNEYSLRKIRRNVALTINIVNLE